MLMTKTRRRLLLLAIVIIVGAVIVIRMRQPHPIPVAVATVEKGLVEASVANTRAGTVEACRRTKLAPSIGGQVDKLLVKKGQHVEAGQPLMSLWNGDLEAQMKLAQSQVEANTARREEACLRADTAERDFARLRQLSAKGLITEEALDQARTNAQAGRATCDAAKASVRVADDQVRLAKVNLDRTIIRAPFAGTVAEINGEPGEYVTPSPPGIPTPPAVDLVDTSCLYVTAPIDEVDAPLIKEGQPARITLDAFGNQAFEAKVRRVAPYVLDVEKQARTVEVEAVFTDPNAGERLIPGYTADVEVILGSHPDTLRIPTEAVLEGHRVLVLGDDGTLHESTIRPGLHNWRYTEVLDGLKPGEKVVTSVEREGVAAGVRAVAETKTAAARK